MIRPAPNYFGASFQSMSALRSSDIQAGRVGTAVDASGVSPALTLLATAFPGRRERNRAMAANESVPDAVHFRETLIDAVGAAGVPCEYADVRRRVLSRAGRW